MNTAQPNAAHSHPEDGFLLVGLIVAIFLVLLVLGIAAPRVAMEMKREREVESVHRANQYVRAIQLYQRKFKGQYPPSLEALKKTNNQRFLRQEYIDPLTGQADYRLIHVGENKTKVKGFFGEDLPGLPGGLGAASGLGSPPSGFGARPAAPGSPTGTGTNPPTTGPGVTAGSGVAGRLPSQDASAFKGAGGAIMGVGSSKSGDAIIVVNEQTTYQDWEFLYDPRVELLKAKVSLLGGIGSSAPGNGLPTTPVPGFGDSSPSPGNPGGGRRGGRTP